MGCGCGKPKAGASSSNPIIFGEDSPEHPVQKVQVLQASAGMAAGARKYVKGSKVDKMIESGALKPV